MRWGVTSSILFKQTVMLQTDSQKWDKRCVIGCAIVLLGWYQILYIENNLLIRVGSDGTRWLYIELRARGYVCVYMCVYVYACVSLNCSPYEQYDGRD